MIKRRSRRRSREKKWGALLYGSRCDAMHVFTAQPLKTGSERAAAAAAGEKEAATKKVKTNYEAGRAKDDCSRTAP